MSFLQNIWQHPKTSVAGVLVCVIAVGGVFAQQGVTLGKAGTGNILTLIVGVAAALLGLIAKDPSKTT